MSAVTECVQFLQHELSVPELEERLTTTCHIRMAERLLKCTLEETSHAAERERDKSDHLSVTDEQARGSTSIPRES